MTHGLEAVPFENGHPIPNPRKRADDIDVFLIDVPAADSTISVKQGDAGTLGFNLISQCFSRVNPNHRSHGDRKRGDLF